MPKGEYTRKIRPAIYPIGPSIAYIPLTKGQYALIDRDDVETVGGYNWCALWNRGTQSFYAVRGLRIAVGKQTAFGMHNQILANPAGLDIDHIHGNTLDNRRCALRLATRSENLRNRRINRNSASGFKGVSWHKSERKWRSDIQIENRRISLGYFSTAEAAHAAYCEAARKHFGVFARFE
jgi:hypothetical protein